MTSVVENIKVASKKLISMLKGINIALSTDHSWRFSLANCTYEEFLYPVQNTARVFFKSRDRDLTFLGLGAADLLTGPDALTKFAQKRATLFPEQSYFAALKFDEQAEVAPEWQDFGARVLVLPIVSLVKKNGQHQLILSFRADGLPWNIWLDHALSILQALPMPAGPPSEIAHEKSQYLPAKEVYCANVEHALAQFDGSKKKVVLGRRCELPLKKSLDPAQLFLKLKIEHAFLFFIDLGFKTAFFGASPELLYRLNGEIFETESLAGTRARSNDEQTDEALRKELSFSQKDNREHSLVSLYIEEKLKELSATDIKASALEVRALNFVQHLLKRYQAKVSPDITDEQIIKSFHPTPAVCGQESSWAKEYIRSHEGFDRGLYAGPIGLLGKDESEFSVGIRSALFYQQHLYIYVASGIVAGSSQEEWEELSHKEKSMLSIFDG